MSADGGLRPEMVTGAHAPGLRPIVVALSESQSVPFIIYGADGGILTANASSTPLLHPGPRLLAHDGTDLWTIVLGRADEANPTFDIRVRLRRADGDVVETTLMVVPMRAAGGGVAGAVVFVIAMPTSRIASGSEGPRPAGLDRAARQTLDDTVAYLLDLVGADCAYVAEAEEDDPPELRVIASRSCFDDGEPRKALPDVLPVPFAGRQIVCIPDGLSESHPDDPWIAEGGYRAYVAVALTDANERRIGVLGATWRSPLSDIAGTTAVFLIVAARAAVMLADLVAARELKESEQRYGAVFEGSAVPMLLVEPQTTQIVDANPAACAFYGFDRDELLAMSVLQIDALQPDSLRSEMQRAVDGSRERFPSRHRRGDGTIREVELHTGVITVGGRSLLYFMVHDTTDQKRMEYELERHRRELERTVAQRTEDLLRANTELQHATVARDMVLANLAQEMRTSLQTITGFSDLMLEGMTGELTEEQGRQLTMVRDAGRRLTTFVTGLIEDQRTEQAESECEPESFDLVALVESVAFGLDSFAQEKGLFLKVVAAERPVDVLTDRYKVQRVLLNLLSNAVRLTEHGGVTITISRRDDESTDIAVADTGPGLSDEVAATVFEESDVHDSETGIGLPASRRIAASLGGTIGVSSELGSGSIFVLHLPNSCLETGGSPVAPRASGA